MWRAVSVDAPRRRPTTSRAARQRCSPSSRVRRSKPREWSGDLLTASARTPTPPIRWRRPPTCDEPLATSWTTYPTKVDGLRPAAAVPRCARAAGLHPEVRRGQHPGHRQTPGTWSVRRRRSAAPRARPCRWRRSCRGPATPRRRAEATASRQGAPLGATPAAARARLGRAVVDRPVWRATEPDSARSPADGRPTVGAVAGRWPGWSPRRAVGWWWLMRRRAGRCRE